MINLDIETNIISLMMLVTLYFSLRNQTNRHELINRLFITLILLTITIIFFDSFQIAFDGSATVLGGIILKVATFIYFLMHPIIPMAWLIYLDYHIFKNAKRIYRIIMIFSPIFIAHSLLVILSINGNYIYYIDGANNYSRGNLLWITSALLYGIIVVSAIVVIHNRSKIAKNELLPLILFSLPPAFGGVLQLAEPGLTIIWPSVGISLLIVYIYIQSKLVTTDYLTGLFNRREYDNKLSMLKQQKPKNLKMSGMVVDIDDFKAINDTYGHNIGDEALVNLGKILKSCVRKDDFVARLGGDEFTVVIMNQDKKALLDIISRVKFNLDIFNATGDHDYEINVSIGFDIYNPDIHGTIDKFFIHLDKKMYEMKNKNKNIKKQV
ncbi:MAG: hypothetical protein CVV58_01505 [Tenericutes bacterium HGW-Tenericutes-3]|nr:MAG: hypothetical protein CVV58_01505 [Tenericutes bacterium HGW-Tenericutes-3]